MGRYQVLLLCVGVVNSLIGTGCLLAETSDAPRLLTPAETQADFDLLRKALEEAHGGVYRYVTKAELDRALDGQRSGLSRPMSRAEFVARVYETLALIRCGDFAPVSLVTLHGTTPPCSCYLQPVVFCKRSSN
jgi:hypothetical protein